MQHTDCSASYYNTLITGYHGTAFVVINQLSNGISFNTHT